MTITQPHLTAFRIDPKTNLFLFTEKVHPDESGNYHIPGNCVLVATPEHESNKWLKWVSTIPRTNHQFGQEGTGSWLVIYDYRKSDLYLTSDGQKYSLDNKQNIDGSEVSYPGYGELPHWLTTEERPSQFHSWDGTTWAPDQEAIDLHEAEMERGWRNGELNRILWLRDRHRDELEQELPTTLTEPQYVELQAYIQLLRDWPAHSEFPDKSNRPEQPQWLNEY